MNDFIKDIDAKTVYSAMQTEINARVVARASINTSHIQVVLAFLSACIALKSAYAGINITGKEFIEDLSFYIGAMIPLISSYYISLYAHNDIQIGLLNKCMRRVENISNIPDPIRFYKLDGEYKDSFWARTVSHTAVIILCLSSPIVILAMPIWKLIYMGILKWDYNSTQTFCFFVAILVSFSNIIFLKWLQRYREKLRVDRQSSGGQ